VLLVLLPPLPLPVSPTLARCTLRVCVSWHVIALICVRRGRSSSRKPLPKLPPKQALTTSMTPPAVLAQRSTPPVRVRVV
jgi:hypothetical protein